MKARNNYLMVGNDSIRKTEKITIYNSDEYTSLHKHDFIELVYFKFGTGKHYINGDYNKYCLSLFNINENEISTRHPGYLQIIRQCLSSMFIKIFRDY